MLLVFCILLYHAELVNFIGGNLAQSRSTNPCTYPSPTAKDFMQNCQLSTDITQDYLVCDSDSAMSISEIEEVIVQLKNLNLHYGNHCVCDVAMHSHCWYKIAFAFLHKFELSVLLLDNDFNASSYCNQTHRAYQHSSRFDTSKWSSQMLHLYGNRFAEVLRNRWNFSSCGEDILILIVKNKPQLNIPLNVKQPAPMLFVSVGPTVQGRMERLSAFEVPTLSQVVNKYNEDLEGGYPLKAIFENILKDLASILLLADQTYYLPRRKNHIPSWAICAFGACAALLILMAFGLFLVRRHERGAFKRAQSKDKTDRRWKAGFVGGMYKVTMFAGTTCKAMLARFWQVAVQPGRAYTADMVNQYQLTHKEVDDVLRRNECSKQLQTFIRSYDANQLPANSPCEDQRSEAYCRLDNSYFFGVFDGHGGQACADAVSKRVYDYMAVSLMPKSLINQVASGSHSTVVEMLGSSSQHPMVDSMKTAHLDNIQKFASEYLQNISNACNVRQAFKKAFQALDDDLVREAVPDSPYTANADAFEAGKSGSCACVAYIKGQDLYIAQLGDSAAILGVCSDDGVWTARKLTQVHTVDNGNEVKRVRAEHPANESLSVLRGERLLGELFPLRAFGDMRFKLPAQTLKSIMPGGDGALSLPANYFTPPYLTAEPSVYYYRLTVNDKFLIIGSDGFWDMVTPEAAVCFASDHMIGFETLVPYLRPSEATFRQVLSDLMIRKERSKKRPADANGATHLIRHALTSEFAEGNPYAGLSYVLSIPKGVARAYRDDITVSVIYFRPV